MTAGLYPGLVAAGFEASYADEIPALPLFQSISHQHTASPTDWLHLPAISSDIPVGGFSFTR
jgi:hypothetical protein